MRDRHLPRLCRSCDAPLARQEDTCWSCEAAWDYRRSARRSAQRVIPADDAARPAGGDQPPALAVIGEAHVARLGAEGSRRIGAQIAAVQ
jgi:hypothetical protein